MPEERRWVRICGKARDTQGNSSLAPFVHSAEALEEIEAFLAAIDEHDDVQNVYVGLTD